MAETRVEKFEQYRASIAKNESKGFRAPSKDKVSPEMGLFLKLQNRKRVENLLVIALICSIVVLLIVFGIKLFGR